MGKSDELIKKNLSVKDIEIAKKNNLTLKQIAFINAYVDNGGNGGKAYVEAGYKASTKETAWTGACKLLKQPRIQEQLQRKLRSKASELGILTPDQVLGYLTEIIEDDKTDSKVKTQALTLLGKRYRLFVDSVEMDTKNDVTIRLNGLDEYLDE